MTVLGIIQLGIEVAAFITSVVCAKALVKKNWWPWIFYLLYTCVVEIMGAYMTESDPNSNNLWLYNPYIIVSLGFYGWFLTYVSLLKQKTKTKLYILVAFLVVCATVWYVVWGDPEKMLSNVFNGSSLLNCILCFVFFYTHIKHHHEFDSLAGVPAFWMVAGILIYHAGTSVHMAVYDELAKQEVILMGSSLQNFIAQVLSLFLYFTVIVSFIRSNAKR